MVRADKSAIEVNGVAVLSFVSARSPRRRDEVVGPYSEMVERGPLPRGLLRTFLLESEEGTMAIASEWERCDALDAMLETGEEQFARRVLREAGGRPEVQFFDVVVERH